jgi:hypothetical protein
MGDSNNTTIHEVKDASLLLPMVGTYYQLLLLDYLSTHYLMLSFSLPAGAPEHTI